MVDTKKMEVVRTSLESADTWEAKGVHSWRNVAWSNSSLSLALMNLLSVAVEEHAEQVKAVNALSDNGVHSLLRRYYKNLLLIIDDVDAGRAPCSVFGGNYSHIVYVHLSWAVEDFFMGESLVAIAERKDNAEISTPFWREYARAMGSLVRGVPYEMTKLRLRGQEEYWAAYLHLIEAASNGRNLDEAIATINQAFARRNADKKIKDDNYETEGTGNHPVKWDYRRDSLLTYISHKGR